MFQTVPLSIIRSFSLYTQQWYMSYRFADSLLASKPVWHIPLLCVQWNTPDDGQRNCLKHAEFYSKNKFVKLVHLVGFIIRKFIMTDGHMNIKKKYLPPLNQTHSSQYFKNSVLFHTQYLTCNKDKVVKCTLVQALRLCTGRTAHKGRRGMALLFHDHGTRRGWGVSVTCHLLTCNAWCYMLLQYDTLNSFVVYIWTLSPQIHHNTTMLHYCNKTT
jgi:hypothetical protein